MFVVIDGRGSHMTAHRSVTHAASRIWDSFWFLSEVEGIRMSGKAPIQVRAKLKLAQCSHNPANIKPLHCASVKATRSGLDGGEQEAEPLGSWRRSGTP